jgi:hypothetical protein
LVNFLNVFGNRFIFNSAVGFGKKGRVRVCAVAAVDFQGVGGAPIPFCDALLA